MRMRNILIVSLLGLLLISPSQVQFWQFHKNNFTESQMPQLPWEIINSEDAEGISFGADGDCVTYSAERIIIETCGVPPSVVKWQSPVEWQVKEAVIGDLNRDGEKEITLVVSRPFEPWPIDKFLPYGGRIDSFHDKEGMSCHIILVGWDGEKYRELWAGSSLIDPVSAIAVTDLDSDGKQEMLALEGVYDQKEKTGNLTIWTWSGFGFSLSERIAGRFLGFVPINLDEKKWLLVY